MNDHSKWTFSNFAAKRWADIASDEEMSLSLICKPHPVLRQVLTEKNAIVNQPKIPREAHDEVDTSQVEEHTTTQFPEGFVSLMRIIAQPSEQRPGVLTVRRITKSTILAYRPLSSPSNRFLLTHNTPDQPNESPDPHTPPPQSVNLSNPLPLPGHHLNRQPISKYTLLAYRPLPAQPTAVLSDESQDAPPAKCAKEKSFAHSPVHIHRTRPLKFVKKPPPLASHRLALNSHQTMLKLSSTPQTDSLCDVAQQKNESKQTCQTSPQHTSSPSPSMPCANSSSWTQKTLTPTTPKHLQCGISLTVFNYRQRQIAIEKSGRNYFNYTQWIPKNKRSPEDPVTPRMDFPTHGEFQQALHKWRHQVRRTTDMLMAKRNPTPCEQQ